MLSRRILCPPVLDEVFAELSVTIYSKPPVTVAVQVRSCADQLSGTDGRSAGRGRTISTGHSA